MSGREAFDERAQVLKRFSALPIIDSLYVSPPTDTVSLAPSAGKDQTGLTALESNISVGAVDTSDSAGPSLLSALESGAIPPRLASVFRWLPPLGPESNPECRLGNLLRSYLNAHSESARQDILEQLKVDGAALDARATELVRSTLCFDAAIRLLRARTKLVANIQDNGADSNSGMGTNSPGPNTTDSIDSSRTPLGSTILIQAAEQERSALAQLVALSNLPDGGKVRELLAIYATPEQIEVAQNDVETQRRSRTVEASAAVTAFLEQPLEQSSPIYRLKTAARDSKYFGDQPEQLTDLIRIANLAEVVNLLRKLDPEDVQTSSAALIDLSRLSRNGNQEAKQFLLSLNSHPSTKALNSALLSPDLEKELSQPGVIQTISGEVQPLLQQLGQLSAGLAVVLRNPLQIPAQSVAAETDDAKPQTMGDGKPQTTGDAKPQTTGDNPTSQVQASDKTAKPPGRRPTTLRNDAPDPILSQDFLAGKSAEEIARFQLAFDDLQKAWHTSDLGVRPEVVASYYRSRDEHQKAYNQRLAELRRQTPGLQIEEYQAKLTHEAASGQGPLAAAYQKYTKATRDLRIDAISSKLKVSPDIVASYWDATREYSEAFNARVAELQSSGGLTAEKARLQATTEATTGNDASTAKLREKHKAAVAARDKLKQSVGEKAAEHLPPGAEHNRRAQEAASSAAEQVHQAIGSSNTEISIDKMIESRTRSVNQLGAVLARRSDMPPWMAKIGTTRDRADGSYNLGEGTLVVGVHDAVTADGAKNLRATLAHEVTHYQQDILIVRTLAQKLKDKGVDLKTPEGMQALRTAYHDTVGYNLKEEFAERVLNYYKEHPRLTDAQIQRGMELAKDFKSYAADFVRHHNQRNDVANQRKLLNDNPEKVVEWLKQNADTAEKRQNLFGIQDERWLDAITKQASDPTTRDTAVKTLLAQIDHHEAKVKHQFYAHYRFQLPEEEAWHVTDASNKVQTPQPTIEISKIPVNRLMANENLIAQFHDQMVSVQPELVKLLATDAESAARRLRNTIADFLPEHGVDHPAFKAERLELVFSKQATQPEAHYSNGEGKKVIRKDGKFYLQDSTTVVNDADVRTRIVLPENLLRGQPAELSRAVYGTLLERTNTGNGGSAEIAGIRAFVTRALGKHLPLSDTVPAPHAETGGLNVSRLAPEQVVKAVEITVSQSGIKVNGVDRDLSFTEIWRQYIDDLKEQLRSEETKSDADQRRIDALKEKINAEEQFARKLDARSSDRAEHEAAIRLAQTRLQEFKAKEGEVERLSREKGGGSGRGRMVAVTILASAFLARFSK